VVYVPPELQSIREALAAGSIDAALRDLARLTELGSGSAAALLGYLNLRGTNQSGIDPANVLTRCRKAAERGDAYAQYVCAWQDYYDGDHEQALRWMNSAVKGQFLPAIADVGRFAVDGVAMSDKQPRVAAVYFRHAIGLGHIPSLMYLVNYARKGLFGWWWRVPALLATPLLVVLLIPVAYLRPFDIVVFAHPSKNDRRVFVTP
jgi:TPR repeat protein